MLHGMFRFQSTCQKCGGEGTIVKDPCTVRKHVLRWMYVRNYSSTRKLQKCQGRGHVKGSKSYAVDIPAGLVHFSNELTSNSMYVFRHQRRHAAAHCPGPQVAWRGVGQRAGASYASFTAVGIDCFCVVSRCDRAPYSGASTTMFTARWT